jgi:uncharacterized protein (TIGR03067 family)
MLRWTLVCLATILFSLAFAPAPFPRPTRRGGNESKVSLARLQGTWTIVQIEHIGKTPQVQERHGLETVRIERDRWSFVYRDASKPPVVYTLAVDGSKKPAILNLMVVGQVQPYGKGLLLRRGNELKALYSFTKVRPSRFEPLPSGYVLMTLRRRR